MAWHGKPTPLLGVNWNEHPLVIDSGTAPENPESKEYDVAGRQPCQEMCCFCRIGLETRLLTLQAVPGQEEGAQPLALGELLWDLAVEQVLVQVQLLQQRALGEVRYRACT